jgi:hypothetical protein
MKKNDRPVKNISYLKNNKLNMEDGSVDGVDALLQRVHNMHHYPMHAIKDGCRQRAPPKLKSKFYDLISTFSFVSSWHII